VSVPHYLIIDLETTGTNSNIHEIIELCGIILDGNLNTLSELNVSSHPSKYMPTHSGYELYDPWEWDSRGAVTQKSMIRQFKKWIEKEIIDDRYIIPVGHGVVNDIRFLERAMDRYIANVSKVSWYNPIDIGALHTMTHIYPKMPTLYEISLDYPIEHCPEEQLHRADVDAHLTLDIFVCQMSRINGSKEAVITEKTI
jgi:DNA polymerase III alpha subunit (gram-positive type)